MDDNGCYDCPGYDAATLDKEIFVVEESSIRLVQVFCSGLTKICLGNGLARPGPCHSIVYTASHGDRL